MLDVSRRIAVTTSSGTRLHDVRFTATDSLDAVERQRLYPINPPAPVLLQCRCGWMNTGEWGTAKATAIDHILRPVNLPVHRIGSNTGIGSRRRNADSYGSAVNDTTGVSAFAVADGIGNQPHAAQAAAVAVNAALTAAITATKNRAVIGLLRASDALDNHGLIENGDTVMVLAVSHPPMHGHGVTWDMAWVGDCDAWLFTDSTLNRLTTPHTQGQQMRLRGIRESLASRYDNVVLTTVGTADPRTLGSTTFTIHSGRLALTSDGVGAALHHSALHTVLSQGADPQVCARNLVQRGLARPRADNATAMVIDTIST
ncbi:MULTISPECIES: PP2C family serine/threonine-protein phosphatase [unclassified Crossiella]|uniref:PP2C family protein-serine/threonine phosphatase n=1 Tax=unclassified Crossiella TaxID=2620835 RepID=UPI001FFF21DA|nr:MULTISPECIES: protein phosphatase 2C domain-containing protein [unclassified Crossiella]MCK2240039.1 protein phosphatase 2C domain-containing protein [Crossiella sp. S99.2]MCK2252747.1 protein phosphatase 2C domain-containing protein [Crossiella sp. S99.1]